MVGAPLPNNVRKLVGGMGHERVSAAHIPARPSEVVRAKRIIESGVERSNEFCDSFNTYPIGKHALSVSEELVQRHSTDLLADGSFSAGMSLVSEATSDKLSLNQDLSKAKSWLRLIPAAGAKLTSALTSWSRVRLEEQLEHFQAFLENLTGIIEHAAALITTVVTEPTRGHRHAGYLPP